MNMIRNARVRLAAALLLAWLLPWTTAQAAATWQDVRPSMVVRGIAGNGTAYVAAAVNGIWTSTDLKTWTQVTLPATAGVSYNDVLWDGSRFIAVGRGLIYSADGTNWTIGYAASAADLWNGISFASGVYVVVGSDAGEVLRSTDGQTWTLTPTGLTVGSFSYLTSVSGSKLLFTGIGSNGSGFAAIGAQYVTQGDAVSFLADVIATSPDGITWNTPAMPASGSDTFNTGGNNNVAWGAGTYVAGGATGVYTSPDGVTWTPQPFPAPAGGGGATNGWVLFRLQFTNSQFIGVGEDVNTGDYAAVTSPDGATWTEHAVVTAGPSFEGADAVMTSGADYVVAGDYGVYTSPDLSTWTQVSTTPETSLSGCLVYGSGKFLLPGDGGSLSSTAGTMWPASLSKGTGIFLQVEGDGQGCAAFGNNTFVALGAFGRRIEESTDGINWTQASVTGGYPTDVGALAWTGSGFVAVGDFNNGTPPGLLPVVLTSPDGKTWVAITTTGLPSRITRFGTPGNMSTGLAYLNGKLVAWGLESDGTPFISVSSDGAAWNTATLFAIGDSVASVAYGNGEFIAIGDDASGNTLIASSPDAATWTPVSGIAAGTHTSWASLIWGNNEFVAGGRNSDTGQGLILTSSDGSTWTLTTLASASEVGEIVWNGTSYVAAAFDDIFEYTPPAPPSSGGGGGGGGGGGTPASSGGGGGSFDLLALSLLSGLAIRRRERWMRES